jgi:hypothetical protein
MSNGYLIAVEADLEAAHAIGEGFGLEVLDVRTVHDREATAAALSSAANLGVLVSAASASDETFVALIRILAERVGAAQLITIDADPFAAFPFLPAWPSMTLDEAYRRLAIRRGGEPPVQDPDRAHPLAPTPPPVEQEHHEEPALETAPDTTTAPQPEPGLEPEPEAPPVIEDAAPDEAEQDLKSHEEEARQDEAPIRERRSAEEESGAVSAEPGGGSFGADHNGADEPAPQTEEPPAPPPAEAYQSEPPPLPRHVDPPSETPPVAPAPAPQSRSEPARKIDMDRASVGAARASSAPADATAFAPGKLRRGTPELVRIVIHQPQDLQAVIKAARKIDPRTEPAPQAMPVGDVPLGSNIGVSLEVKGAACDGALQRRVWQGDAIDFNFAVEADSDVKQVVFLARVFINDAQIGVLAFMRKATGPAKKPASPGDRVRLKRHKRVFISYSSKDRETVAAIATAYQAAGVEHFFDRTSLKSGEEWSPRLRREIDRADLFHLCWSRQAAESEWVVKEAEHAMGRRRKAGKPEITVQMLDGPPWAKHPDQLDAINFDDFVRAAIVGYARGDGGEG